MIYTIGAFEFLEVLSLATVHFLHLITPLPSYLMLFYTQSWYWARYMSVVVVSATWSYLSSHYHSWPIYRAYISEEKLVGKQAKLSSHGCNLRIYILVSLNLDHWAALIFSDPFLYTNFLTLQFLNSWRKKYQITIITLKNNWGSNFLISWYLGFRFLYFINVFLQSFKSRVK